MRISACFSNHFRFCQEFFDPGRTHFPKAEQVIQEFWLFDARDREKTEKISRTLLRRREAEFAAGKKNTPTHKGQTDDGFPQRYPIRYFILLQLINQLSQHIPLLS